MSGVTQLVTSGPLILALPVAAAAGAVTFLSPCCLPLVPGYLSFVTGMAGASGSQPAPVAGDLAGQATPLGVAPSGVAVAARPAAPAVSARPAASAAPAIAVPRPAPWAPGRRCSCSASPWSSSPTGQLSAGSATC